MNTLWCIHRLLALISSMKQLIYSGTLSKKEEKPLKTSFAIEFGKHLKKIRKKRGLTQEELAHKANLHSTYVGHIETGTYTPSIFVVWKIAQVLKMKLWEYLKDFE